MGKGDWGISGDELEKFNERSSAEEVAKMGGVEGLAKLLVSDLKAGLKIKPGDVPARGKRVEEYGDNIFKEAPPTSFFSILWEALQDHTLILLMVAATVSVVLGLVIEEEREKGGYLDGLAIWAAVIIVSMVGATNDYQKELQFRKLNTVKNTIDIKVIRCGSECLMPASQVLVGDVLVVEAGDKVCADGVFVRGEGGEIFMDESSHNGESEPARKSPESPFMVSGTTVSEGAGAMLVTAVGSKCSWGRIIALTSGDDSEKTPLQEKLEILAGDIGKAGMAVAVIVFVILLGSTIYRDGTVAAGDVVSWILFCITIVVVAVPEGLPLAVTLSLAYSVMKMMSDMCLVRYLAACETMGSATQICSDKTGTLTENRMTIVKLWSPGSGFTELPRQLKELGPEMAESVSQNLALNSKAFLSEDGGVVKIIGSRTEGAALLFLKDMGLDYKDVRAKADTIRAFPFNSTIKMSAAVVRRAATGTTRAYVKGAPERVLALCDHVMSIEGGGNPVTPLTPAKKAEIMKNIDKMSSTGLRVICLAAMDMPASAAPLKTIPQANLTFVTLVGIKDPVRKEVPKAVMDCQRAGIVVRMVTGDAVSTARHIAKECNILTDDGEVLEGEVFRNMTDELITERLPKLQVLARASPVDKHRLVRLLKASGEVVAATGDGTNDAPQLRESDVGLSMGMCGTEVAKDASDIVILDDNFASIVRAVLWGRSVTNNIRKFLQFQLTVNMCALSVASIAAVLSSIYPGRSGTPLNVLELLWVNLVMDAMGALALATEDPDPKLLDCKPGGRTEALITAKMWKHIVIQGLYQLAIVFGILYIGPEIEGYAYPTKRTLDVAALCGGAKFKAGSTPCKAYTVAVKKANIAFDHEFEMADRKLNALVFNAFIWCQLFNEINARRINDELNVFESLLKSKIFVYVLVISAGLQALFMQVLYAPFHVLPLNGHEWAFCVGVGSFSIVLSFIIKIMTPGRGRLESTGRVSPKKTQ